MLDKTDVPTQCAGPHPLNRVRAELFPWRLMGTDYVVQVDQYYTKVRRAWPVTKEVTDLIRAAAAGGPFAETLWNAFEAAFSAHLLPDRETYAGCVLGRADPCDPFAAQAAAQAVCLRQPLLVSLEVTRLCNLRCAFCYTRESSGALGDTKTLLQAVERAAEVGALFVNITGGEPTLHPELDEVLNRALALGVAVVLRTNLVSLPRWLGRLREPQRVVFATSFHHPDTATFDGIVGRRGAKEQVLRNIATLVELGVRVRAHTVVTPTNVRHLARLRDELEAIGVPLTLTDQLMPAITSFQKTSESTGRMSGSPRWSPYLIAALDSLSLERQGLVEHKRRLCSAASGKLWLGPDGGVYPCELFREQPIGDYRRQSLAEVLASPEAETWRRVVVEESEPGSCQACALRNTCSRCPATVLLERGTPNGCSEATCGFSHELAQARARAAV